MNQHHEKTCLEKSMPVFVPILLILFVAGFFIGILWVEKIRSDRVYLNGNLYQPSSNVPAKNTNDNPAPVVGSDRDEHGCIGSAGYSWCEEKKKCLRNWEESCDSEIMTKEKCEKQGGKWSQIIGEIIGGEDEILYACICKNEKGFDYPFIEGQKGDCSP